MEYIFIHIDMFRIINVFKAVVVVATVPNKLPAMIQ